MVQKTLRTSATIACGILVGFLITAATLPAQRLGPPPPRPALPAEADTNDAEAYHDFAMDIFDADPQLSAAGFYWAARIHPEYASALYGRRAAIIVSRPDLLTNYTQRSPNLKQLQEFKAADSLLQRALTINPFLFARLDKRVMERSIVQIMTPKSAAARLKIDPRDVQDMAQQMIARGGPQVEAWASYNNGAFRQALALYAVALKTASMKAPIYIERARIFGILGDADSAVFEFHRALDEMRKKESKDLVRLYNSKAMLEHSIGILYEHAEFVDEAREAYGRAIQEDLSFYPSHVQLGVIAAGVNDTTTALSELSLAAQIAKDEPHVLYKYGVMLARFGKNAEAMAQLSAAITQEPFYARPYPQLVALLEAEGNRTAALAACDRFLQIASRRDVDREAMTAKRAALAKVLAGGEQGSPKHSR